ncbi:serine/threonine-protein kinase [Streptomyces sp. JJ36]|uniref:serine/threonine-protein kinase n=1 Tax=Streptomyces sp. JJ36 TaxID=2736645 RepID=UPI001F00F247|nr:serine/threonine-protein kinase [Streptomyces sp. JJ36]MCF6526327.1 protein kinase [Streptomyces sp. JJ36]
MGEVFAGRYELADPVGRGGAGAVWRAWDHRRGRYVAAKVLQQSDAHTLLRFVREQALRIDHPHVLAPASWAADDDKVLFTMDLVAGGSLAHLVAEYGPLPPAFTCTLLDQLLAGLSAVHAEEVVHRDVKPANILLEPTGTGRPHVRLSDFGISMRKGEPRLTETDFVVGTPGYFAPEQMRGAEADFTADLYAAGLVGLSMLTGERPDAFALLEEYERAGGVPAAPDGVPEPLWQVLGGLLQPDPQDRFRTATGARRALAGAAELLARDDGPEPLIDVTDRLGPLPEGFGPSGPVGRPARVPGTAPGSAPGGAAPPGAAHRAGEVPGAAPDGTAPGGETSGGSPESATGSFHLAPPQPTGPASAAHPGMPGVPGAATTHATPVAPHSPAHTHPAVPAAGPAGAPGAPSRYAVPQPHPQLPPQPHPAPGGATPGGQPVRRPGPPAKVAVPVLLVALLCLAVGTWALTAA